MLTLIFGHDNGAMQDAAQDCSDEAAREGRFARVARYPENRLHPKDQLLEASDLVEDSRGRHIIVITHSEMIMLRVQSVVRAGYLPVQDVRVLWAGTGQEPLQLRLDSEGDFMDEWPEGFFHEGFDERFGRYTEEIKARHGGGRS